MNTVHIRYDTCHITLLLDKLPELPVSNIRKLFKMVFLERWRNEEAIQIIENHITYTVPEAKAAWHTAAVEYSNGWRFVKNKKSRCPEVVEVLKENGRLTRELKHAKSIYERWVKIQALWNDTKLKLN